MVTFRPLRPGLFRRSEAGVTMVEGLITFPIVLLMLAAMGEFGYAVHQWNQTVKAMQLGARLAAVSDPLTDLQPILDYYESTGTVGYPPPAGATTISCGAGTATPCDTAQLNRLVYGVDASGTTDDTCDPNFGTNLPGICDFHRVIKPENIRITYDPSGLGYVGRPGLPIVTITLETRGLHFQLPLLGALLGLNTIEIPAHPVTTTSEDLSNHNPGTFP